MTTVKKRNATGERRNKIGRFLADCRDIYVDNLQSVICYDDMRDEKINFIVFLHDDSVRSISKSIYQYRGWEKMGIGIPLFSSEELLVTSCGSHPVSMLNIFSDYDLIYGVDLLKNMTIQKSFLQHETEYLLQEVVYKTRFEFLGCVDKKKKLASLVHDVLLRIYPLLKALLYLENDEIPSDKEVLIQSVERCYNVNTSVLFEMDDFSSRQSVEKYISLLDSFLTLVDTFLTHVSSDKSIINVLSPSAE